MPVILLYELAAPISATALNQEITLDAAAITALDGRTVIKDAIVIIEADVSATGSPDWTVRIEIDGDKLVFSTTTSVTSDKTIVVLPDAEFLQTASSARCIFPIGMGGPLKFGNLQVDLVEVGGTGTLDACRIYLCWPHK